ncbi:hypothetical protein [Paenibacillus sp.]|uniref:hypothetical protein n=1 Tax=Paenibacillus sp. TaxID=58172 RepID=UPI003566FFDB
MEQFKHALNEAISSWSKLSEEWEKIEETHSDTISENYPFDKDFREILNNMIEWREGLQDKE